MFNVDFTEEKEMYPRTAKREYISFRAHDLDDAFKRGHFTGSIDRYELLQLLTKANPQLDFIYHNNGIGLYDQGRYVSPIGTCNPIPKYLIQQRETQTVLAGGWVRIAKRLKSKGYKIPHELQY